MRAGKWSENFHLADFRKQDYFLTLKKSTWEFYNLEKRDILGKIR